MPKIATLQTNFSGGELSPYLYGRVDIAKYNNGTARMQNFHPLIQGGALSRPGSRDLGAAAGDGFLFPFVYSRAQSYQIELTALKLRIWRAAGTLVGAPAAASSKKHILSESAAVGPVDGATIELVTPWSVPDLAELNYEQADDTMFFFHKSYPTYRLQRLADQYWRLEAVPFVVAAFGEQGFTSTIDVTISAVTVGTGRTLTAASAVFLPSDVGRDYESGTGSATITAFTSTTVVVATVTSAFDSTVADSWSFTDSPQGFVWARALAPLGSTVVVDGSLPRAASITLTAKTGAITINASAAVFVAGDTGKALYADAGVAVLTFVSATQCTATTSSDFLLLAYQAGAWGITGDVFRSTDVGSYLRMNGGLLLINAYASAAQVQAEIRSAPTALVSSPPGAWSLEQAAHSSTNGYPRAGALHEQRLYLAGSLAAPQTIWASRIGEFLNFESGLNDADGFTYTLNTNQRNPAMHLTSGKRLFALTEGSEISLRGGNEKAMGPTNIQKENESRFGANNVRPVPIGREVLFVQGTGRKVRALGYSAAIEGFDSPDRTVFAEHVTTSGVVDMAYQPQEHSLLYCVRADGQMAVAAYDVGQEVVAWCRWVTASGYYRSVSVIPRDALDDVWTLVNRPTLAGVDSFRIERFEAALATDSAASITLDDSVLPVTVLTGLTHLNGRTVQVKADGSSLGTAVVAGGAVTLTRDSWVVEAGLPINPELEMLPPDVGGGGSSAQGSNVSVHEVIVRLLDTTSLEINGELSDFRRFGTSLLDEPPPGYTGDYRSITLTDDLYKHKLVIRQPGPFKTHVQAVIRKLTVNDV